MFGIKSKASRNQRIDDYLVSVTPHESLETKVYKALKRAGKHGLWNYQIAALGMSADRRLRDLRADGVPISSVRQKSGAWKYYLIKEEL